MTDSFSPIMARIRKILAEDPNFYVPVKKLHQLCADLPGLPPYDRFLQTLRDDTGLAVEEPRDEPGQQDDEEREEMEAMGFFDGPRVRLKERVPTPEDIMAMLQAHTKNLMDSLSKAYVAAVDSDAIGPDEEDQLLSLMQHSQELRKQIEQLSRKVVKQGRSGVPEDGEEPE